MNGEIPMLIEELYYHYSYELVPGCWPRGLENNPVQGHGLWSFYQGLKLGMGLGAACLGER